MRYWEKFVPYSNILWSFITNQISMKNQKSVKSNFISFSFPKYFKMNPFFESIKVFVWKQLNCWKHQFCAIAIFVKTLNESNTLGNDLGKILQKIHCKKGNFISYLGFTYLWTNRHMKLVRYCDSKNREK